MALFIAVEGLDGSGGTTQVRMLCDALDAHGTREPSDLPVGRLIRASLASRDIGDGVLPYLFAADRKDHLEREIEPTLALGQHVVTDRYYHSSLAYQSLAAPLDFVMGLNAGFRAPDVTVFLDLSPEECLERIAARSAHRDRFETLEQLKAISESYGVALALLAGRGERIAFIDARGTPDEVHARVMACLP